MIKLLKYVNPYSKLWKLFFANFVISLVVVVLFWDNYTTSFKEFAITIIWAYSICFTQWVGHVYINNKLNERFSWRHKPALRIIFGVVFVIGYAVIAYLIVQFILTRIFFGSYPENFWEWTVNSSIYAIIISAGVTLLFTAIGFFKAWKKSVIEAEQFKTQMLAYKYEALQNQINPHFLFNSFNVLTDLVHEDQNKAANFIKELSSLFRYVLDSREKELVPIAQEIEFLKTFVYLLKMRFEDKLVVTIDVSISENEFIVPMALQLLVENCVKHNEVSKLKPLNILVKRSNKNIEVVNNLQPKNVGNDSKGIGLDNLNQQYIYFTDKSVVVEKSKEQFSVKLPILIK